MMLSTHVCSSKEWLTCITHACPCEGILLGIATCPVWLAVVVRSLQGISLTVFSSETRFRANSRLQPNYYYSYGSYYCHHYHLHDVMSLLWWILLSFWIIYDYNYYYLRLLLLIMVIVQNNYNYYCYYYHCYPNCSFIIQESALWPTGHHSLGGVVG